MLLFLYVCGIAHDADFVTSLMLCGICDVTVQFVVKNCIALQLLALCLRKTGTTT